MTLRTHKLPHTSAAQARSKQTHRAFRRIVWLFAAVFLAYAGSHTVMLSGLAHTHKDSFGYNELFEMGAVALFPIFLLVGFGARTLKWGLWLLGGLVVALTFYSI